MSVLQNNINHIVVLMLENRSFDNLLGFLYTKSDPPPRGQPFDGLTGDETNPGPNGPVKVSTTTDATNPDPDPLEHFPDYNQQLLGEGPIPNYNTTAPPPMDGFVLNYQEAITKYNHDPLHFHKKPTDPSRIMASIAGSLLPNLTELARDFAVCDQWFCSVPAQTWPNRRFAMAATSKGDVDNTPVLHFFETIFDRFDGKATWGVFGGDIQTAAVLFPHLFFEHLDHFHLGLDKFQELCGQNDGNGLPNFCWMEPYYFNNENDMHPPSDVVPGDYYIGQIYNCLRDSKKWPETLFIITFDEHGGTYDHFSPPATAVQPDSFKNKKTGFKFERFGARVPTVLISPYIESGTVYRTSQAGKTLDHTSVIATLRERFDLGGPLTKRDGAAPILDDVFNLTSPRTDGPRNLQEGPGREAVDYSNQPLNDLQKSFVETVAHIPDPTTLQERLSDSEPLDLPAVDVPTFETVGQGQEFVQQQMRKLTSS